MSALRMLVVPSGGTALISRQIDRSAIADWRMRLLIHELPAGSASVSANTESIRKGVADFEVSDVLIPKGLQFESRVLKAETPKFIILDDSYRELVRDRSASLKGLVTQAGLDFESSAIHQVAKWVHVDHGDIPNALVWARTQVEKWRRQFVCVDAKQGPVLADEILRCLDVMPTFQAAKCATQLGLPGPYGFIQDEVGKSWGVMANALRKSHPRDAAPIELLALGEAVTLAAKDGRTIRVMEDGLFSCTETLGVVESLMGERSEGDVKRRSKTPKLEDPEFMYRARQEWAFGCVTDYGMLMFQAMLRAYGFTNVGLHIHMGTKRIRLLQNNAIAQMQTRLAGIEIMRGSDKYEDRSRVLKKFRTELSGLIVPSIGEEIEFRSGSAGETAAGLCQLIGGQLWRSFLLSKFCEIDPIRWTDERIARCSLGMDGMGLAFGFAHSIPRAALPVLWARGKVKASDGREFDWEPLFPNAE